MKKICVYTCITGEYDDLKEINEKEKGIDYYCFTNNPNLKSNTWKIIKIDNEGLDNQRLARKIKILSHPILDEYDITIWQDASVSFIKKVSDFINTYTDSEFKISFFKHYCRKSIKEEAKACIELKKDDEEVIKKQIEFYKKEKFPDNLGLYETTVFIKSNKDEQVKETMKIWFDMILKYSKRDQLSLTYALYKTGLKVNEIDLNVWDNNWFKTYIHNTFGNTYDIHYIVNNKLIIKTYYYKKEKDYLSIDVKIPKNIDILKIVVCIPSMIFCHILKSNYEFIIENGITTKNGYISKEGGLYLTFTDVDTKKDNIKLDITLSKIDKNIYDTLNEYASENERLKQSNDELIKLLRNVENSVSYKITKPLRLITRGVKK